MDNTKIYCPVDGHAINFSNASNFCNDSHTISFHTKIEGEPGKNYVFYKANIMGYCIEWGDSNETI